MKSNLRLRRGVFSRALRLEALESRLLLAIDLDDSFSEAAVIGSVTTTPRSRTGSITEDTDVDMYRFTVTSGQVVDFDIDTPLNGPGGLGSFLRIFNSSGQQLAFNNDGMAPGENVVGFDAYLRHTFAAGGIYFVGVSNATNNRYDPVTGNLDTSGGLNATGEYQLTVQALPVDNDDSLSEATALGALSSIPEIVNDEIFPDIDVDLYRFSASAGQVASFDIDTPLNGPGGLGSFLRLFDSAGTQLAFNNDGAAPGETLGFDAFLRFNFTASGTYYVGVSNVNNDQYNPVTGGGDTAGGLDSIGDYQLTVQVDPPVLADTDDELGEAASLGAITTTPRTISAGISPDIDVDMYRFTVAAGQSVDFDIDTTLNGPGGLGSFLRLFNAAGEQLAFNNDAAAPGENTTGFDAYLRHTFANSGTFFIAVSNANNRLYDPVTGNGDTAGGTDAIGDYQLIVHALPIDTDDSLSEAPSLGALTTTPTVVSGSIATDIDVDLFAFTVGNGQTVDFDIDTPLNGPGGLGSYLRLFNASGQQLAFNNNAAAPGENIVGIDAYLRHTFAAGGTFFIGVSNANNILYNPVNGTGDTAGGQDSIGTYQLIVQVVGAAPPGDSDDTLAEAAPIGSISTTPKSAAASVSPDTDVDMYRFTVTAGQTVDFDIDTNLNGPGGLGSFLRLFNSSGQQLAVNNDGMAPGENVVGFDAYLRHTFTAGGTYFVAVSNANNVQYNPITGSGDTSGGPNATGDYLLTVQALPVDSNDSLSEAVPLGALSATPRTVNEIITPDVDVDMFRFTVTAGQVVAFDIDTVLNGPGGLGSFVRLFNASGTQLAFNNDGAAPGESLGFDAYLRHSFAAGGTYFLGVSNSNNRQYNPVTGGGDAAGGLDSVGAYQLTVHVDAVVQTDGDDTLFEARRLGALSPTARTVSAAISPDVDVDMYRFTVTAGQVVDFDIDTAFNGVGGVNSHLRLFNGSGQQLALNNNGAAPGENSIGFDAYLRHRFAAGGVFFLAVSNATNTSYNAITGNGDTPGGADATGAYQLIVRALPVDRNDSRSEAIALGRLSRTPRTVSEIITPDIDVDMFRFTVTAGQTVDFDIDTPLNGAGGLGSYLRLFNASGQQLAFNNDGRAPGENVVGLDAYLRFTFAAGGTYFLGVSNSNNIQYNPLTGNGDTAGGFNSVGSYQLIVRVVPSASGLGAATSAIDDFFAALDADTSPRSRFRRR